MDGYPLSRKYGEAIKKYRLERGRSQFQVSMRSGIPRSVISTIERGSSPVKLDVAYDIVTEGFGLNFQDFMVDNVLLDGGEGSDKDWEYIRNRIAERGTPETRLYLQAVEDLLDGNPHDLRELSAFLKKVQQKE